MLYHHINSRTNAVSYLIAYEGKKDQSANTMQLHGIIIKWNYISYNLRYLIIRKSKSIAEPAKSNLLLYTLNLFILFQPIKKKNTLVITLWISLKLFKGNRDRFKMIIAVTSSSLTTNIPIISLC